MAKANLIRTNYVHANSLSLREIDRSADDLLSETYNKWCL